MYVDQNQWGLTLSGWCVRSLWSVSCIVVGIKRDLFFWCITHQKLNQSTCLHYNTIQKNIVCFLEAKQVWRIHYLPYKTFAKPRFGLIWNLHCWHPCLLASALLLHCLCRLHFLARFSTCRQSVEVSCRMTTNHRQDFFVLLHLPAWTSSNGDPFIKALLHSTTSGQTIHREPWTLSHQNNISFNTCLESSEDHSLMI